MCKSRTPETASDSPKPNKTTTGCDSPDPNKTTTAGDSPEPIDPIRAGLQKRRSATVLADGHALDDIIDELRAGVHWAKCEPGDLADVMADVVDIADRLTLMRHAGAVIRHDGAEATSNGGCLCKSRLAIRRKRRHHYVMVDGHRLDQLVDDLRYIPASLCVYHDEFGDHMAALLEVADQLTVLRLLGTPVSEECVVSELLVQAAVPTEGAVSN